MAVNEPDADGLGFTTPDDDLGFYSSYEAKEILGSGLTSTVRRCVEKGSGTSFAVKVVDISTERQPEKDARRLYEETISEVQILRQLVGHPSIIAIHDFYETPSFLFTVFEMAPRGELFDVLNATVTARRLMKQLLEGVKFMHDHRIVHRDLKLENILCIDDERIVISDFGFALHLEKGKMLRDLCGTPGYLAPETLRCQMYEDAKGYGLEVDEWALGYAPFYHRRQLMMMRLIQEGRFEFRREQWEQVTAECKELVTRLLTVDVSTRITAAECLQHQWMAGIGEATVTAQRKTRNNDKRKIFRHAIIWIRFFVRLSNYRKFSHVIDRDAIKKRPFRDREIRHEAESAMFCVYGHWVNRGFHYSRDLLFANAPKPKLRRDAPHEHK